MSVNKQDFDKLITDALSEEEASYYKKLAQPSIIELVTETFTGRYRVLTYIAVPLALVIAVLTIYAFYQMYLAVELRDLIIWSALGIVGLIASLGIKIWFWMQMTNNQILRELKRLELQIASLAHQEQ